MIAPSDDRVMQFCVCRNPRCWCMARAQVPLRVLLRGDQWECPSCRLGRHITRDHQHIREGR